MSAIQPGPAITPFLWFNNNAEDAVAFYLSVFPNSRRITELRSAAALGHMPAGSILTIAFELNGLAFTALNGGPDQHFTPAVSFVVTCADQAEIDRYWAALTAGGGREIACGWLEDKFGLSWQIVPRHLPELVRHPAAFQAMMTMTKLDVAALERAAGNQ